MKPKRIYGQVCPIALTSELLAERWMPLVVRELVMGSRRFADIHRGIPRISPTLLTRRLRELERAEVVTRRSRGSKVEYELTMAGLALMPIIEAFGIWGKRFAQLRIRPGELDPGLMIWDLRRWIDVRALPQGRSVILLRVPDAPRQRQCWWLVADQGNVELCLQHPGFDVDLTVDADTATLARVWRGDVTVGQAIGSGRLKLAGSAVLSRSFGRWIGISPLARARTSGPLPPPKTAAR